MRRRAAARCLRLQFGAVESPSSTPPSAREDAARLDRHLALFQVGVFGWIAIAALLSFAQADPGSDAAPDRAWTVAGIVLAVGAISLRRFSTSPVMRSATRVVLGVLALLLAAAVAACGVGIAWDAGPRQPALAFSLGAALLALRRPSVGPPTDESR